ncbi:MAG TPA: hypothetical protein VE988_04620 [Gemmataceae bacterium]|nr:hypothetical protein [Gemmataceae bacterium]
MFVICQYFSHSDPARAAEFEFCIRENIKNGHQVILFEEQPVPEDIRKTARRCIEYPERLTYAHALKWANENLQSGSIVALINLDIMIRFEHAAVEAHFQQYPNHFLCLSRLEYNPENRTTAFNEHLEKYQYMNCQDAWVFQTPVPELPLSDFPIGNCPGCDNAIAFRAAEKGLVPINLAAAFPIWHYDFVRPKNPFTLLTQDTATKMVCPEKHGRLFLPRIAIGGSFKYDDILGISKNIAQCLVEESGYTAESDVRLSSYLACSIVLRGLPVRWDVAYLFGCIAMSNCFVMKNSKLVF